MKIIAMTALSAIILLHGVPAEAQSYYARQSLVGLSKASPSQYPGKWTSSSATSACVSGSKTVTVTGTCSGGTCDPATDPSRTTKEDCSRTCPPLKPGYAYSPSGSSPSTEIYGTSLADLLVKARTFCNVDPGVGGCLFGVYANDPAAKKGSVWIVKPTARLDPEVNTNTTYWYGAVCS